MFKRLYNWIKFKTLPSSILFKNRLFVERDSKHRRVMSNFGLTFRNSKWSDYAIQNITMTSLSTFTRLIRNILLLVILTVFMTSYLYYYNTNVVYNNITYILWSFLEDMNYFVAYSFWTVTFTISFLIHKVYTVAFTSFYGTQAQTTPKVITTNLQTKLYKPAKNFHSPILISFLTNPSTTNSEVLEQLFKTNEVNSSWITFYKSFKSLYTTNLNLMNVNTSTHLNNLPTLNSTNNYAVCDLTSDSNFSTWFIFQTVNNNTFSSFTSDTNSTWNLYTFASEVNKYNNLIVGKKNLFYLNNLNFNMLNYLTMNYHELFSLSQSLVDQTKVVKWNRWLYRYNILHRKTIKNSHKLTMVKKLLSTGFYDTSMMSNNMWTSTFFSKSSKPLFDKATLELMHSQFNLLYKDTFSNSQTNSSNFNELNVQSPSSPLNMLRYFETSYFWFVKRFYMYNTLNTNVIKSNTVLEQNNLSMVGVNNFNNTFSKYSLLLNTLIRSSSLTNGVLNPFTQNLNFVDQNKTLTYTNLKDIILVHNDMDVFNVDNLEIITNYNNLLNNTNTDFNFFNTNEYTNSLINTTLAFNSKPLTNKSNNHSPFFLTNVDVKLITDLYILMLINK